MPSMASMPNGVSPVSSAGRACRRMIGRSAATERPETMAKTITWSSTAAPERGGAGRGERTGREEDDQQGRGEGLGDREGDAEHDPEDCFHTSIVTRPRTYGDGRSARSHIGGPTVRPISPRSRGSNVSLLPETGRRVDEIAARAQADGRTPSLALAVVRDRAVLHFAGRRRAAAGRTRKPSTGSVRSPRRSPPRWSCSCATRASSPSTTCSTGICRAPRSAA